MKSYKVTASIVAICLFLACLQAVCPTIMVLQVCNLSNLNNLALAPLFLLTIFTYMFSHGGFPHLFNNMTLGIPVMLFLETKLGGKKLLKTYILCGLIAFFVEAVMTLSADMTLIGASGAIMGCFAASCAIYGKGFVQRSLALGLLMLKVIPNLQGLSIAILGMSGHVAFAAHIGGVLMGLFLMTGKHK